jgi:hypothetical protein
MHSSTFEYLKPTNSQLIIMEYIRKEFAKLASVIEENVPEGPDRIFAIKQLRTAGMWCNVAITRQPDGSPR